MGLGKIQTINWEWLSKDFNNMTLGIHSQEWSSAKDFRGSIHQINQLYIGLFFFRIVIEMVK